MALARKSAFIVIADRYVGSANVEKKEERAWTLNSTKSIYNYDDCIVLMLATKC